MVNINFKDKNFLMKSGAVSLLIIAWSILIGWKYSNPNLNLKYPIIITGIISIISIIAFFSKNLLKQIKTEDKIPEPMNEEEIRERIEDEVAKFWNHIKISNGLITVKTKAINKNLVCAYRVNLLYKEKFKEETVDSLLVLINANYRNVPVTFMLPDSSEYFIEKEMNNKSFNPKEEPDEELRKETDLSTGKEIIYKKKTHKKKKEEEKSDIE